MKPISSAIITDQKAPSLRTGMPGGERGLQTLKSSQRIATWLAAQRPADMDKAAVSRALSHGVGLQVKREWRFPSGENGERLAPYEATVGCQVTQSGDHKSAAADLRNFLTPAPVRQIEGWLAELSVIVARRKDDNFADELRVSVYSARLAQYPADVARSAVIGQTYRFWPTWGEMEKVCKSLTAPRLQMIAALDAGPVAKEPERRSATQEERDRIATLVNEMFPNVSQEWRDAAVSDALHGNCMTGDGQT